MLSPTIQQAMNEQIGHEFYSAYAYLSLSGWCEAANLPGAAQWLRLQAEEELGHAMKFYQFILDRGARVALPAIPEPPREFASLLEVFQQALAGEQRVSGLINRLYGLAVQEQDYASQVLLNWFVNEQVEEEKITGQAVETLKMIGDNTSALLMFDRELGTRQAETEAESTS